MSRSSKLSLCLRSPPPKKNRFCSSSFPASRILLLLLLILKVLTLLLGKFQRHNAHAKFRKNRSTILYVEMKGHTEGMISIACLIFCFVGKTGD